MALKRKRSNLSSSSPSSSSTSSVCSNRESPSPTPNRYTFGFRVDAPFARPHVPLFSRDSEGGYDLSGRTRKRYRDNRPDEAAVYVNTFQKLFAAQRQPSPSQASNNASLLLPPDAMDVSGLISHDGPSQLMPPPQQQQQQPQQQPRSQTSLHKFFNISSTPSSNLMPSFNEATLNSLIQCEDCDRPLDVDSPEDDMMIDDSSDINMNSHGPRCRQCARAVCDLCVVGDYADRMCLQCFKG